MKYLILALVIFLSGCGGGDDNFCTDNNKYEQCDRKQAHDNN